MPEFILEGRDHAARTETDFTLGFIEAMFFTSDLGADVGYDNLDPQTLQRIRRHCHNWQAENLELLTQAYRKDYTEIMAGRDLWFTSQGHGVGFWDRGLGDLGEKLSNRADRQELHPYIIIHMEI